MEKIKMKCRKCGHKWESQSKLGIIICSSCGTKNKNPKFKLIKENKK